MQLIAVHLRYMQKIIINKDTVSFLININEYKLTNEYVITHLIAMDLHIFCSSISFYKRNRSHNLCKIKMFTPLCSNVF